MLNAITVDVEEWYEYRGDWVARHYGMAAYDAWRDESSRLPSSVVHDTECLLRLLASSGTRATFFVLGSIADREPGLLRTILADGHELATHGYDHVLFTHIAPHERRDQIARSVEAIWSAAGVRPAGFRAPCFSIDRSNLDVFHALEEFGLKYDCSLFPVRHPLYGVPGAPRTVYSLRDHFELNLDSDVMEVPPATLRTCHCTMPVGSSTYLRLMPIACARAAIRQLNSIGQPATFAFHSWEANTTEGRLSVPSSLRFRHSFRRRSAMGILEHLLAPHRWDTVTNVLAHMLVIGSVACDGEAALPAPA